MSTMPEAKSETLDISPNQDGGVLKHIIQPGTGNEFPSPGDTVEVHYTGSLESGEVFDSSVSRNQRFQFTLGKGEVIKGWDLTVATMKRGEKCKITLSPEYAYGEAGSPPKIGPNAVLIFEIELFDWSMPDISPDQDKTILMHVLKQGEGYDRPRVGSVLVNLTGRIDSGDGEVFDKRDNLNFKLGEGSEQSVISGIECALRKMKKGETVRVYIKSPVHAFGKHCPLPEGTQLPDHYEQLVYDVELINFENEKETWEMSAQERLEQAELTKEKGTTFFKQGKFELALRQYQKIIQYVGPPDNQDFGDQAEERDKHLLSGYLNLAICYLKLDQPDEVIKNTDLALKLDNKNPKALFRRGLAHYAVKEYEKAIRDFNQCLEVEPTNKAAKNQIVMCKHQLKQHAEMEKKIYRNLFEALSKEDD